MIRLCHRLTHSQVYSCKPRKSMELVPLKSCCVGVWPFLLGTISLCYIGSEAVFLSFPINEMALVNESVEFQCSTDSCKTLRWSVTYSGTTENITLFTNGTLTALGASKYRHRMDASIHGQLYRLIIDSVDLSFAGKYRCTEESVGQFIEADLAIIDSMASCQTNASSTDNSLAEYDYLWMQCILNFSGNVNLRMDWIRNSTNSVQDNSIISNRYQTTIIIQVNSSDNGETFAFKATFTQENNSRETVITWNNTVKVLYAPRNLVVSPVKSVYTVGDRLECSAGGNPTPSYEWTDIETNKTTSGSILAIEEYMYMKPDQNHAFRCTAYNTVGGLRKNISETAAFNVTGSTMKTPDTSGLNELLLVLYVVIGVAVITFCCIPITGYFCFRVYSKIKLMCQEAST